MKKSKAKTGRKAKRSFAARGAQHPKDLAAIRQRITELVSGQALSMVETTIAEADKGHYAAMKYLFEIIGLYPTTVAEEAPADDSMTRILLRRLGLPEEPMLQAGSTPAASTASVETAPVSSDAVE